MAPPEDMTLGFLGLESFISPMFSAARWMGLSSPLRFRELIVLLNWRVRSSAAAVRIGSDVDGNVRRRGCESIWGCVWDPNTVGGGCYIPATCSPKTGPLQTAVVLVT